MATQTPSNIYSGGATVLNTQPYVAYATNMMAHQAAKDEALDNYYRDLNKSINPAGVRNQDMDGFIQKTNDLQNFWQQNRDKIKNPRIDNGKSQTEYNSRYQDALGYINESKQEELKKKPFVDMLSDPNKRDRITDKMISDIHQHDLPLNDPNRKSFDITQEEFAPQPFEVKDWQDYYKNVGADIKPDKNDISTIQDPNDKFSQIETTTARYSQPKLRDIGDTAKNDYYNSNRIQYSFQKAHPFKEWASEHPDQFNNLSDIYKKAYGNDAKIQDDADLHAAIVLSKKIEPTSTSKRVENFGARRADQQQFEMAQQKRSQNFQAFLKSQPTWKEKQSNNEDSIGAENVLNEVKSIIHQPSHFDIGNDGVLNSLDISDPTILGQFKDLSSKTSEKPNSVSYNAKTNKLELVYKDKDGAQIDKVELDPKTYLKIKVKQSFPNKDIGNINNIIDKYYEHNGGNLLKMVRSMDKPSTSPKQQSNNYKHTATGPKGQKAYSNDGVTWVDENGKPL